jgi:hypothetical protein
MNTPDSKMSESSEKKITLKPIKLAKPRQQLGGESETEIFSSECKCSEQDRIVRKQFIDLVKEIEALHVDFGILLKAAVILQPPEEGKSRLTEEKKKLEADTALLEDEKRVLKKSFDTLTVGKVTPKEGFQLPFDVEEYTVGEFLRLGETLTAKVDRLTTDKGTYTYSHNRFMEAKVESGDTVEKSLNTLQKINTSIATNTERKGVLETYLASEEGKEENQVVTLPVWDEHEEQRPEAPPTQRQQSLKELSLVVDRLKSLKFERERIMQSTFSYTDFLGDTVQMNIEKALSENEKINSKISAVSDEIKETQKQYEDLLSATVVPIGGELKPVVTTGGEGVVVTSNASTATTVSSGETVKEQPKPKPTLGAALEESKRIRAEFTRIDKLKNLLIAEARKSEKERLLQARKNRADMPLSEEAQKLKDTIDRKEKLLQQKKLTIKDSDCTCWAAEEFSIWNEKDFLSEVVFSEEEPNSLYEPNFRYIYYHTHEGKKYYLEENHYASFDPEKGIVHEYPFYFGSYFRSPLYEKLTPCPWHGGLTKDEKTSLLQEMGYTNSEAPIYNYADPKMLQPVVEFDSSTDERKVLKEIVVSKYGVPRYGVYVYAQYGDEFDILCFDSCKSTSIEVLAHESKQDDEILKKYRNFITAFNPQWLATKTSFGDLKLFEENRRKNDSELKSLITITNSIDKGNRGKEVEDAKIRAENAKLDYEVAVEKAEAVWLRKVSKIKESTFEGLRREMSNKGVSIPDFDSLLEMEMPTADPTDPNYNISNLELFNAIQDYLDFQDGIAVPTHPPTWTLADYKNAVIGWVKIAYQVTENTQEFDTLLEREEPEAFSEREKALNAAIREYKESKNEELKQKILDLNQAVKEEMDDYDFEEGLISATVVQDKDDISQRAHDNFIKKSTQEEKSLMSKTRIDFSLKQKQYQRDTAEYKANKAKIHDHQVGEVQIENLRYKAITEAYFGGKWFLDQAEVYISIVPTKEMTLYDEKVSETESAEAEKLRVEGQQKEFEDVRKDIQNKCNHIANLAAEAIKELEKNSVWAAKYKKDYELYREEQILSNKPREERLAIFAARGSANAVVVASTVMAAPKRRDRTKDKEEEKKNNEIIAQSSSIKPFQQKPIDFVKVAAPSRWEQKAEQNKRAGQAALLLNFNQVQQKGESATTALTEREMALRGIERKYLPTEVIPKPELPVAPEGPKLPSHYKVGRFHVNRPAEKIKNADIPKSYVRSPQRFYPSGNDPSPVVRKVAPMIPSIPESEGEGPALVPSPVVKRESITPKASPLGPVKASPGPIIRPISQSLKISPESAPLRPLTDFAVAVPVRKERERERERAIIPSQPLKSPLVKRDLMSLRKPIRAATPGRTPRRSPSSGRANESPDRTVRGGSPQRRETPSPPPRKRETPPRTVNRRGVSPPPQRRGVSPPLQRGETLPSLRPVQREVSPVAQVRRVKRELSPVAVKSRSLRQASPVATGRGSESRTTSRVESSDEEEPKIPSKKGTPPITLRYRTRSRSPK